MIETKNNPYYDDYDVTKGFLKVLFKPGLSVQTRELNQLQSILQNQIGSLSDSIFKDGSVVKDGKLTFKNDVSYVKLYNSYNNSNFNYDNFKDRLVAGNFTLDNNEVVTVVAKVFDGFDENNNNPATLYLDYLGSGTTSFNDENIQKYNPGQVIKLVNEVYVDQISDDFVLAETIQGDNSNAKALLVQTNNNKFSVLYENALRFQAGEIIRGATSHSTAVYQSGETEQLMCQIQQTSDIEEPTGVGSFAIVSDGVYYVEGYFVNVLNQKIILKEYSPTVSAKVGFSKEVKYISATDDNSLYDNANGTPNENAPGADRLKLNLVLTYYNLYDEIPDQFIEIARINQSNIVFNTSNNSQWSNILDLLARRTYDESGNYTVNSFIVDINELLDEDGNNGIYKESYFACDTEAEARNMSMEMFNELEPGTYHNYNLKYYPMSDHPTFLQACRDRVAIGINPGLAYVMGYEVKLDQKIYVPMEKARDYGVDNNSLMNLKYGNYCVVNELSKLPNINTTATINLCSSASYNTSNIIGTARLRMMKRTPDSTPSSEKFRFYITDISMNGANKFANVKSLGLGSGESIVFTCKAVLESGKFNLYDVNQNKLLFNLSQSSVRSLEDIVYYVSTYMTSESPNRQVETTGHLIAVAPSNTTFYSVDPRDYILVMTDGGHAGQVIDLTNKSITITNDGNTLDINVGVEYASCHWKMISPFRKNDISSLGLKKKNLVVNQSEQISSPAADNILAHLDGYRLVAVYESVNSSTPATTSDTNVTDNYEFDGGQKDDYYGPIHLKRKANTAAPAGQLLVVYEYFAHTAGDYYDVSSYTRDNAMAYEDIPTYTSSDGTIYKLNDCVDFRPDYDSRAPTDYDNINGKTIAPDSNFESDINYYLPRIDLLEVDYLGEFKIKKGISAVNPQTPTPDINSMGLYYMAIPSYTPRVDEIAKVYKETRRYTMRDIGILDARITAIENYIMLNQNEMDISNMSIIGVDGNEKYKVGFIADNFLDHSYGDLKKFGYKCSIDVVNSLLMPSFKLNSVKLTINPNETSTVVEKNGKYMIPYSNVTAITQTTGTSLQRMNENGLISWVGNLLISPSVNNIYNNIDQSKQNLGDTDLDYLNQINEVIGNTSNTLEYGNFYKNWLGVK